MRLAHAVVGLLASMNQVSGDCSEYLDSDNTYHVVDYGLGSLDEYINHWNATDKTYTITFTNGTVQQTGTCQGKDEADGACASICTAEGPGIPKGYMGSLRTYTLPEKAGAVYSCYNFGDKPDVPDTCVGAANYNIAKKI